jgi:hypothetical protein
MHKQTPINLSQHCHKDLMPSLGRGQRVFLRYKSGLRFLLSPFVVPTCPNWCSWKKDELSPAHNASKSIFPVTNDSLWLQKETLKKQHSLFFRMPVIVAQKNILDSWATITVWTNIRWSKITYLSCTLCSKTLIGILRQESAQNYHTDQYITLHLVQIFPCHIIIHNPMNKEKNPTDQL